MLKQGHPNMMITKYLVFLFNQALQQISTRRMIIQVHQALTDRNIIRFLQSMIHFNQQSQHLVTELEVLNKNHTDVENIRKEFVG